MRNIAFVMLFQTGFQIFGTANVKCSGSFVNKDVNAMKAWNNVCGNAVPYCPASSALQITPRHSSTCVFARMLFPYERLLHRSLISNNQYCQHKIIELLANGKRKGEKWKNFTKIYSRLCPHQRLAMLTPGAADAKFSG